MAECWGCGVMFEGHSTQHFCVACKRFARAIAPVTVRTDQPSYVSDEEARALADMIRERGIGGPIPGLLATRKALLEAIENLDGTRAAEDKLHALAARVRKGE